MKRFKALRKEKSILNRKYLYLILFDLKALLNYSSIKNSSFQIQDGLNFLKFQSKKIKMR